MIDFYTMLELFRQAGMVYPPNWKEEELKKVEDNLRAEIIKASSILS
jgi:hypothetical protein